MIRAKVTGLDKARALFAALPGAVQRESVREALRQAAEPTAEAARGLAPRGDGGMDAKAFRRRDAWLALPSVQRAVAEVGAARVLANSKFKDLGKAGSGKHLADSIRVFDTEQGQGGEGDTVSVAVSYPRRYFYGHFLEWGTRKMAARPFLRPAWDATKEKYLPTFGEHLWASIRRALPSGWAA